MAASTAGFSIAVAAPSTPVPAVDSHCRRRISPRAGRALEMLGHAIEYLADEYVHGAGSPYGGATFCPDAPQVKAIQLLMALNREIYFECPVVPSLADRLRSFLRAHFA